MTKVMNTYYLYQSKDYITYKKRVYFGNTYYSYVNWF